MLGVDYVICVGVTGGFIITINETDSSRLGITQCVHVSRMPFQTLLIVDCGSQYTQLLAKAFRQAHFYCEIRPWQKVDPTTLPLTVCGVVVSGSPASVHDAHAPTFDFSTLSKPVLGVCYGAQLLATQHSATVVHAEGGREYGRQTVTATPLGLAAPLLAPLWEDDGTVWMSHGDAIRTSHQTMSQDTSNTPPSPLRPLAYTAGGVLAAFSVWGTRAYGLQFHPEVTHTDQGRRVLAAFARDICGMVPNWRPEDVLVRIEADLRAQLDAPEARHKRVVVAVSGGVDSTVTATLLHRVAPERLVCVFVNNGLLRLGEANEVRSAYAELGIDVVYVDTSAAFLAALAGVTDPEAKRKAIGGTFVETFVDACQANGLGNARDCFLAQGTIYPDVVESAQVEGGTATVIKSHHNVGGLPEALPFALVEPLRWLFKDDVRALGAHVGIPAALVQRHPFPGPGLAIRVLGEVTPAKVALLQRADKVYIDYLRAHGLYARIWQAGAMLLPVRTVGVQGDARTYEHVVALRAVTSVDGMTAECYPFEVCDLAAVATRMIGEVKGVGRVVYDVSSKPPATVEWE